MPRDIRDYALIGDCETAALVGCDGSIDWLCWPRFDSDACFAALLGSDEHGCWRIAPKNPVRSTTRRYREATLILETRFETESGAATLIDFMPIRGTTSDIVRIVIGERGRVEMGSELRLRFDYGRLVPWTKRLSDGGIESVSGPHAVTLNTAVEATVDRGTVTCSFAVEAGERIHFTLTYCPSHLSPVKPVEAGSALDETVKAWREWAARCNLPDPWGETVVRSLITMKALTYAPTGGIIAAPTTSLPEQPHGTRNWDYRFCWLRDATFTLLALVQAGYRDEAAAWRNWLLRAAAGMPHELQPIYGIAGEHRVEEWEVPWLPGYQGAAPVRVGNLAHNQLQLDMFGQILDAMFQAHQSGLSPEPASWTLQTAIVEHLEKLWTEPDSGIWEVRSGSEHFTYSKVMTWVAFDRAIRISEKFGLEAPLDRWRNLRREIHQTVCRCGYDPDQRSFVRSFGSKELDASNLLIPLVGFLPADDPRIVGTTRAIEQHLMRDGFVYRYDTSRADDGLPPGEGTFLACTFWYADNLILQGRHEEGREVFERLLEVCNDVGLLPEQYDPATGQHLGNFPQALSHLSLVDTAYNLASVHGPAQSRAEGGGGGADD